MARQFCELRQVCYTRMGSVYFQLATCQASAVKKSFETLTCDKLHEVHVKPLAWGQKRLAERQLQPNERRAKVYRVEPVTAERARTAHVEARYDVQAVAGTMKVPPEGAWED